MPELGLGWTYNPIPQTRAHWKMKNCGMGVKTKVPVTQTRKEEWHLVFRYKQPDFWAIIRGYIKDSAAKALAAAGGLAAALGNVAVAWPTFKEVFFSELKKRISNVASDVIRAWVNSCRLSKVSKYTAWK